MQKLDVAIAGWCISLLVRPIFPGVQTCLMICLLQSQACAWDMHWLKRALGMHLVCLTLTITGLHVEVHGMLELWKTSWGIRAG